MHMLVTHGVHVLVLGGANNTKTLRFCAAGLVDLEGAVQRQDW